ncbi:class I SAM-dependent methyltransferase [Halomicrococcus gelatinilyticus]|uniref:class I SAM-dependent methyltransferase n=1 Tax=Halomicrococcus gelatinilyticus TaxID=1702103 RepID=UPI002E0E5610
MTHAGDVAPFDRFARFYDRFTPSADADLLAAGLAQADRPVERVVDVAGGTGRAVRAIDVPERLVVDASDGMLRQAHSNGLESVRGNAARLPLADGSVDAAIISDALHHVADVNGALGEAARVLRPGGVLVVREYNPATLRGTVLVWGERIVGFDSEFLTPDDLVERLDDVGLTPRVRNRDFDYTVAGVR